MILKDEVEINDESMSLIEKEHFNQWNLEIMRTIEHKDHNDQPVKVHIVKPSKEGSSENQINDQLKKDTLSFIQAFTSKSNTKTTSGGGSINERAMSVVEQYKFSQKLLTTKSNKSFLLNQNLKTIDVR